MSAVQTALMAFLCLHSRPQISIHEYYSSFYEIKSFLFISSFEYKYIYVLYKNKEEPL